MAYLIGFYLMTGLVISIVHHHDKNYSNVQKAVGFLLITLLWVPLSIARLLNL